MWSGCHLWLMHSWMAWVNHRWAATAFLKKWICRARALKGSRWKERQGGAGHWVQRPGDSHPTDLSSCFPTAETPLFWSKLLLARVMTLLIFAPLSGSVCPCISFGAVCSPRLMGDYSSSCLSCELQCSSYFVLLSWLWVIPPQSEQNMYIATWVNLPP